MQKNGVINITEVLIGYDGIVIANSKQSQLMSITRKELAIMARIFVSILFTLLKGRDVRHTRVGDLKKKIEE